MRIPLVLLSLCLIVPTSALAKKVQTDEAARTAVSRSNDCTGLRDLALDTELCWRTLDMESRLSNEQRAQKRAFSSFFTHVQNRHNVQLGCKPPLDGLGNNGGGIPDRETEMGDGLN